MSELVLNSEVTEVDNIEEGVYTDSVRLIAPKIGKYYCTCGHIGVFKDYYTKNRFSCEECGKEITYVTNATQSTSIYSYSLGTISDFKSIGGIEIIEENGNILTIEYKTCKVYLYSDHTELHVKKDLVYVDVDTMLFKNKKGKELQRLANNIGFETYKVIVDYYINKLKYPFKCRGDLGKYGYSVNTVRQVNVLRALRSKSVYLLGEYGILDGIAHDNEIGGKLNLDGTNLEAILGFPKSIVKMVIKKGEFDTTMFKCFCKLVEVKRAKKIKNNKGYKKITNDIAKNIINTIYAMAEFEGSVAKTNQNAQRSLWGIHFDQSCIKMGKLLKWGYNLKTLEKYLMDSYERQGILSRDTLNILYDYASMCRDLKIEFTKYPRSVKLLHDITMTKYSLVEDAVTSEKLGSIAKENKDLEYKGSKYQVVILSSGNDFVQEGNAMRHCVASYSKRVAKDECIILSVRGIADIEKRYATMELVDTTLVQIQGFANHKPPKDVVEFIKQYSKKKGLILVGV